MWYFNLLRFGLMACLLIYYGAILIEVFTDGKLHLTEHDLNDSHIWIPFYVWLKPKKNKRVKKDI